MVSKFNNRRINTPDGWFDSQRELKRWGELKLLERAGQIKNLQRQVQFELVPKSGGFRATYYVADFVYEEKGKTIVEDSKGFRDRVYMLKRKLMMWRHGIDVCET
jgi:uncharacterized protein DUF1064